MKTFTNGRSEPIKRILSSMWLPLYHLLVYPAYVMLMRFASLWIPKIRRGLKGRSDWRGPVSRIRPGEKRAFRVHFHAASVGEFEQAKPLIEALRRGAHPYRISASFYSPSGYEQQGKYGLIEGACYIPHDRPVEMSEFMNRLSPDLIIIIRYDLWLEFLHQSRIRTIPVVLACGVLHTSSKRFLPLVRSFFIRLYGQLSLIHCVDEEDRRAFNRLVPRVPAEVSGDTRYDRVMERAGEGAGQGWIPESLIAGRTVLVAGSTWPDDEMLLRGLRGIDNLLLVIVPHEPTDSHVSALLDDMGYAVTLSNIEQNFNEVSASIDVVVVDRTGILGRLYAVADIAYVGGGFGRGVHSILEPAAYGLPVLSGPKVGRSRDAGAMAREGVLRMVATAEELRAAVGEMLAGGEVRAQKGREAAEFVRKRTGATERILASLRERDMLPS